MKFMVLTFVLLISQVWSKDIPLVVALNNEMNRYHRLAEYAVRVSMNVSVMVTEMTEAVFMKSDEIENRAMLLEDAVISKAQDVSPRSIKATDCVQNIQILRSIKDMKSHVQQSTKCLHVEANINAMLETLITTSLNHHRSHVIEGRRAMEMCSLAPDSTFDATNCIEKISSELMEIGTQAMASIKKIEKQAIERRRYLTGKMRICESLSSKFVKAVERNMNKLRLCEGLTAN